MLKLLRPAHIQHTPSLTSLLCLLPSCPVAELSDATSGDEDNRSPFNLLHLKNYYGER